jgi:GT2 family glycosyltransferase
LLSISIVVYLLEPDLLKQLLKSITEAINNLPSNWQVIPVYIIDNGNQLSALTNIESEFAQDLPGLIIVPANKNIGYGNGHNLAISKCHQKYHLILNPDVIVDSNSLIHGIDFLEKNNKATAISPYTTDESGIQQYLCKRYPSVLDLLLRSISSELIRKIFKTRMDDYETRDLSNSQKPAKVKIISGCFMLCRTKDLLNIGGFDKRYFLYFEDFALSLELGKYGSLYYLPTVKIIHLGGNASRKGFHHIYMFICSAVKFFRYYGWKII